jgi:hypothetical protein
MLIGSLEVGGVSDSSALSSRSSSKSITSFQLAKANAHNRAKKSGFDAGKAVQQGSKSVALPQRNLVICNPLI